MAIKRKVLTLDEATLTSGAAIAAAGGSLPRRIGVAGSLKAAALALSPDLFYDFDEASGTSIYSTGTYALTGTLEAQTSRSPGVQGGAIGPTSSGRTRLALLPNSNYYKAAYNEAWSVSFWWFGGSDISGPWLVTSASSSSGYNGMTINWQTANGLYILMMGATGSIGFAGLVSYTQFPEGRWNHIVVTCDGGTGYTSLKVYVNGVSQSVSASWAGTLQAFTYGASGFGIGGAASTNQYGPSKGRALTQLGYWKGRALTPAEVASMYVVPGSARARWVFDLGAGRTVREVALPGNLSRRRSATSDARLSRLYVAIAAGARAEYELGQDLSLAADGGVTLDVDLGVGVDGISPYIGGPLGEGPVVVYEEADPVAAAPNVTSIASHDGYIDVTLDTDVGTVAAPTSDAAPAVQLTGATEPAPGVVRLATGPAYTGANISSIASDATGITLVSDIPILSAPSASYDPFPATHITAVTQPTANSVLLMTEPVPANVVSIDSAPGRINVTFDQPLGHGTTISNDPNSSLFVTGDSILGSMLTVFCTGTVPGGPTLPTIGDPVTFPTPAVDSTNATGIFQGAIIIRSAIIKALQELRENPTLIRDALSSLPQDVLTSKKYGEKTIDECVRWFTQTNVPVKLGLALTNLTSPCISVELTSSEEAEATLGDVDYKVIERDPWNPTQARELASVHSREAYSVIMMVQGEPEFLLFLDTLVRFGILRHKEDLLDDRGFARLTWSVGPAGAMQDVPGRENFFARTLRLNGFARNCWPVAPKPGQPMGFIESTHFGPRVAPVAQNSDGTATSVPVTPSEPGPAGADPFDVSTWLDRDIVSGKRT